MSKLARLALALSLCSGLASAQTVGPFPPTPAGGGATPGGISGDIQTNNGSGGLGAFTPGTTVVTALQANANASTGFPQINGAMVVGHCLKWSATGIQDNGSACAGGGLTLAGSSGAIQTNNGSGNLGSIAPGAGSPTVTAMLGNATNGTNGALTQPSTWVSGNCVKIGASGGVLDVGSPCASTGNFLSLSGGGTVSGSTSFTNSGGTSITGDTSGAAPAAGAVGQVLQASISSGSGITGTTSGVAYNVTSIGLTPGDWDCTGVGVFYAGFPSGTAYLYFWLSTTSASIPVNLEAAGTSGTNAMSSNNNNLSEYTVGPIQILTTGTPTVYLSAVINSNNGGNITYGKVRCRRMR